MEKRRYYKPKLSTIHLDREVALVMVSEGSPPPPPLTSGTSTSTSTTTTTTDQPLKNNNFQDNPFER